VGILFLQFFKLWEAIAGTAVVMIIVLVIFRQRLQGFYHRIEDRFLTNLNNKPRVSTPSSTLTPWDAHIARITISASSSLIGKSLQNLKLREKYGINIAIIERGNRMIYTPSATENLYPFDEIGVIGTDRQLKYFSTLVQSMNEAPSTVAAEGESISLVKIIVDEHNRLKGQTIKESGIREKTNGLVVGIERNGRRILNPVSDTAFEWEDVVWLVGDRHKIRQVYHVQV
jgi:CPA2 family monovalent cation:H+ antiporter-2